MTPATQPAQLLAALNWRYATKAFDTKALPAPLWEALQESLAARRIRYRWLGEALGGLREGGGEDRRSGTLARTEKGCGGRLRPRRLRSARRVRRG